MNQRLEKYYLLLNSKLDRVREAESLTLVQYNLIENKQYDELAANLEKRNAVMVGFEECNQEIDALNLDEISPEDKKKADEIENQIKDIMQKIRSDNEKLKAILESRRDECKESIKKTSETKKGILGYAQYSYSTNSRYFDKKS